MFNDPLEAILRPLLINIGGATVKDFNNEKLLNEFDSIHDEYMKNNLDSVRDQFIAHLDMSAQEVKTDIHMLSIATNQVTSLYNQISVSLQREEYIHDDRCIKGIKSIFSELDELERIKAIITAAQVNNRESINVSELL